MAVVFLGADCNPSYIIEKLDIGLDGKIPGGSYIGKTVYAADTQEWFIIKPDLVLAGFSNPQVGSSSDRDRGQGVYFSDSPAIDAFARLRVSNPQTLFDSKNIFDDPDLGADEENQPLFYDNVQISGSGTSTGYNVSESSQTLFVSADTIGARVRQTKMRFNYQPGKSQLILLTYNMDGLQDGITKREGFFDGNNGIFLQAHGSEISIVRRSSVSGTPVDVKVTQSNWNVDKMDGTGISGINLDFEKTQILLVDLEWLGVGRVRVGFVIDGIPYYCHYFNNANNLAVVYMQTPNLPLRSEISNDGTGEQASITQICSTVISEGGSQDLGVVRYISTSGTHLDANAENTVYALIAIKLKDQYLGASVKLLNAALQIQSGSHKIEWILKLNPTVAGTLNYTSVPRSAVQYALGATANTVTGGIDITGGFTESGGVQLGNAGSSDRGIDNALLLGSTVAGVSDVMVLCVRPIGGSSNVDVEGSINYRDIV